MNTQDEFKEFLEKHQDEFKRLDQLLAENKYQRDALINILHGAQEIFGYLPRAVQQYIAHAVDISLAEVYGVTTFYSYFTLEKQGKHKIAVCMGTACYVKGGDKLLEKIQELLNIKVGETTEDGLFTLAASRCIGACGLAPVFTIDDDVYGRLVPEQIPDILAKYRL